MAEPMSPERLSDVDDALLRATQLWHPRHGGTDDLAAERAFADRTILAAKVKRLRAENERLRAQVADLTLPCVHCGEPISYGPRFAWGHVRGPGSRLQSCDTAKSRLPYGYKAHPEETPCEYPCLGHILSGDEVQHD